MLHRLNPKRTSLNALESALLAAINDVMAPAAKAILQRQIASIGSVDRDSSGRETGFRRKQPEAEKAPLFPHRVKQARLASVTFMLPGVRKPHMAELRLDAGRLAVIAYTPPVSHIDQKQTPQVERIVWHCDPMQDVIPPVLQRVTASAVNLPDWLKTLSAQAKMADINAPLSDADRKRIIQSIASVLPEDYRDLTDRCEGFLIGHCAVLGLSEVYEVSLPDGNYYILADIAGEAALAVRSHAESGEIFLCPYNGDDPIDRGSSFADALKTVILGTRRR